MVELVDRIATSTGLDRTVAEKAIGIVLDFLSKEGPADKVSALLARLSGKATSKTLDALGRRGFDIRGKLSAPISRVPRRAPPPKPKSGG